MSIAQTCIYDTLESCKYAKYWYGKPVVSKCKDCNQNPNNHPKTQVGTKEELKSKISLLYCLERNHSSKGDKRKMTELTREKLNKILEEHKHWINEDCKNWEKMRADLRRADLSGTDLLGADLYDANLRGANLREANLSRANLSEADLRNADLRDADFRNAILRGTDLYGAYLLNADLSGADLRSADLSDTDLRDADLRGTDLRGANLRNADLSGANNVPYIPMVCPEEGDFIGWKKAEGNKNKVIVKLHIPSDAKRSSATTRKCRCSKAEVIAIYNLDGTVARETTCHSDYDNSFIYEVGKTVEVTDFSEDRWRECAKGIHFFINRQEAIDY